MPKTEFEITVIQLQREVSSKKAEISRILSIIRSDLEALTSKVSLREEIRRFFFETGGYPIPYTNPDSSTIISCTTSGKRKLENNDDDSDQIPKNETAKASVVENIPSDHGDLISRDERDNSSEEVIASHIKLPPTPPESHESELGEKDRDQLQEDTGATDIKNSLKDDGVEGGIQVDQLDKQSIYSLTGVRLLSLERWARQILFSVHVFDNLSNLAGIYLSSIKGKEVSDVVYQINPPAISSGVVEKSCINVECVQMLETIQKDIEECKILRKSLIKEFKDEFNAILNLRRDAILTPETRNWNRFEIPSGGEAFNSLSVHNKRIRIV
ncbi:unnamed protein product [Gordionus sp. m RMFG-2023]|uniref:uncharacterized protein LOC135932014 n=1 Tax=Gordionus sp. m RMFG-2023 TaxID=3053472 RepID=UPI0030DF52F4